MAKWQMFCTSWFARGSFPIRCKPWSRSPAPAGPGLKNEMVLPAVLDPWAASALYEAAALAAKNPGSKLWLVSLGPKAKLQQVMMTVAQKVAFELVPIDGPIGGFPDAHATAAVLAETIAALPGLDRTKLLLFGGWESATRGAGVTLQFVGERLGISDQFQGVDQIDLRDDGSFEVLERVEGGKHQVSVCAGTPAVLGWATGNLAEPRNNPQVGMANMRTIMPALAKAKAAKLDANGLSYVSVEPAQAAARDARGERHDARRNRRRAGRVDWSRIMENILVLTHADETGSALTKASLEAVTAGMELAARLSAPLTIGIVAADAAAAASAVASTGARLLAVSGEAFAQARYATDAAAVEALCRAAEATIVLAPGSSRFTRIAAGVAHRLGGFIDTHITALSGAETVEASRWFYRQRIEAVISRAARPWFLLLDAGTHAAFAGASGAAQVEQIAVRTAGAFAPRSAASARPRKDAQTIRPDAKMLFVAGAGWTKKQPDGQIHAAEAGELILGFLRATGASLGSSKSLVDQGGEGNSVLPFLTHMNQIGQTGSTPRHAKGLVHLLPRRRAARGGLALHRRPARHLAGPQLRLDARQGRRGLHRRRLSGDGQGQRAAGSR